MPNDVQADVTATDQTGPGETPDFGYGRREPAEGLNETEAAIATRRSVRGFLADREVPRALVERILNVAARAPSGTNVQPWHVTVVTGAAKRRVSEAVHAQREGERDGSREKARRDYNYYPTEWFEPYLARRRKVGWDLYGLLGIARGERERTWVQHGRNYDFFDAPVGLFFHMDKRLELGSWFDMGMFFQSVMVAARSHGLDTCPQAAWVDYPDAVAGAIGMPGGHVLLAGMSMGWEDTSRIENGLYTERAPAAAFTTWLDGGDG